MFKLKLRRAFAFILAAALLASAAAGCGGSGQSAGEEPAFRSFLDIPGITEEDIAAVAFLRESVSQFSYAVNYSTEAFNEKNGELKGFAALFCDWLTVLFEIPFLPRIVEWDELIEGLESGEFDFTGELTANALRRQKYIMTDDIAQRQLIYIRTDNESSLQEIAASRPLRYAFLDGTTTIDDVRRHESRDFDEFFVDDYPHAYEMLISKKVDAFFDESPAEAAFDF
ncbi:MAG: transporter substrate-binding domain-containing protein, partial [Defluviitaleaceae bacterium]|nr:transporter substrate-binding domain-containing protein [Defluviitaleaceae bacterium]